MWTWCLQRTSHFKALVKTGVPLNSKSGHARWDPTLTMAHEAVQKHGFLGERLEALRPSKTGLQLVLQGRPQLSEMSHAFSGTQDVIAVRRLAGLQHLMHLRQPGSWQTSFGPSASWSSCAFPPQAFDEPSAGPLSYESAARLASPSSGGRPMQDCVDTAERDVARLLRDPGHRC